MAITSVGYDGTVDEVQWATMVPAVGSSQYGVAQSFAWQVRAGTNPGQINIDEGSGWGSGVYDTVTGTTSLTQTSLPSSGTRWDLVAMRRDWTPPNGVSQFVIIKGTSAKQLPSDQTPSNSASTTGRNVEPGVVDDQPIALVQWTAGKSLPTAIIDLRVWAGNGGMVGRDEMVMQYLWQAGTSLWVNGSQWVLDVDVNGFPSWWNTDDQGAWIDITPATNWSQVIGRCRKVYRGAGLQIDLETKYVGPKSNLPTKAGWYIGYLPSGYKPASPQLVTGMMASPDDNFGFAYFGIAFVGPNSIQIAGPSAGGSAFKFQTVVALR